jgi:hypothetical protein
MWARARSTSRTKRRSTGIRRSARAVSRRSLMGAASDPRFGPVTQLSTGANSHYNGLQLTADKRSGARLAGPDQLHLEPLHGHGFERRIPAVSPRAPFCRRCRAIWGANTAPAITTCATTSPPNTSTSCPSNSGIAAGRALNGWQVSGTAFWHSGLPFSVLSAPYSANGNGIVQGSGPQYASVVPGVPLYEHNPISGVTQPGTIQWLNPDAFVSAVDPSTGACAGGDSPGRIASSATSAAMRCAVPISSGAICTSPNGSALTERVKLRVDGQFFNMFNHPNFGLPVLGYAGIPGQTVDADRLRRAQLYRRRRPRGCWGSAWAETARRG